MPFTDEQLMAGAIRPSWLRAGEWIDHCARQSSGQSKPRLPYVDWVSIAYAVGIAVMLLNAIALTAALWFGLGKSFGWW